MSIVQRLLGWLGGGGDDEREPAPDDMVLLTKPRGEPEALMLKEILADNGIQSLMKNRDGFTASRNAPGPWWSYELWVLQRDYGEAAELVREVVTEEA
jgi:ATP-dependent exoDNAse (exonuclease V) beta subunit